MAYAIDRAPSGKADPAKYFGGEREPLSSGMVTVGLKKHSNEIFWRDKLSTDKDNGALDITPLAPEGFDQRISDRSLLVYVHGYKRSFARSAEDVARIAYGIDYRGIPMVYSWPSRNSAAAYQANATTVRWSALYFRQAVARLAKIHDVDTIHLMAHSMGNQALTAALASAGPMSSDENWKLGEVIMVAPDVDRDHFLRDAMPVLRSAVPRTTLYISNLDVPLRTSLTITRRRDSVMPVPASRWRQGWKPSMPQRFRNCSQAIPTTWTARRRSWTCTSYWSIAAARRFAPG